MNGWNKIVVVFAVLLAAFLCKNILAGQEGASKPSNEAKTQTLNNGQVDEADKDDVAYDLTLSRDIDCTTLDHDVWGLAYDGKGGTRDMDGPCSDKSISAKSITDKIFPPYITSGFAGQLLIKVVDENSNNALVGVTPYIYTPTAQEGPHTDEFGESMFPLLNAGIYTLGLSYSGYRNAFPSVELYPNQVSCYVLTMKKKRY